MPFGACLGTEALAGVDLPLSVSAFVARNLPARRASAIDLIIALRDW